MGVKGTMSVGCKGKAVGGQLGRTEPREGTAQHSAARVPPSPQSPARTVAGPRRLWDSPRGTPTWRGTEKEKGFSYVGLMILPHVHVRLAAVPDVVQGEELPREPHQWSPSSACQATPPPRDTNWGRGTETGRSHDCTTPAGQSQWQRQRSCSF